MFAYLADGPRTSFGEFLRPARSDSPNFRCETTPGEGDRERWRFTPRKQGVNCRSSARAAALRPPRELGPAHVGDQRRLAHQRLAGRGGDLHLRDVPGLPEALEVDDLVVARATAQAAGIRP